MASCIAVRPTPLRGLEASGSARFCGVCDDSDMLVDCLIASCTGATAKPALPGAGRDLVPFFQPKKQARVGNEGNVTSTQNKRKKRGNRDAEVPTSEHKAAMAGNAKAAVLAKTNNKPSKTVAAAELRKLAATPAPRNPSPPARSKSPGSGVWAGPGFCNSPTPECLPMPTVGLLAGKAHE